MEQRLDRIEAKLDKIVDELASHRVAQEGRVARLELVQKGMITVLTATVTAAIGAVLRWFHV